MAPRISSNFFSALRKGSKAGLKGSDASALISAIKKPDIKIKNIDSAFDNLPLEFKAGRIEVNNVPLNRVASEIKGGRLIKAFDDMKVSHTISKADELAYQKTLINIPEKDFYKMNDTIGNYKNIHPDLDITVRSADDIKKLPSVTRQKIDNALDLLKKGAVGTGIVFGIVAVIKFGIDAYEALVIAADERKGCFKLVTSNRKTKSCKVSKFSCNFPTGTEMCANGRYPENIANMMMFALTNNSLLQELQTTIGSEITADNIKSLIDDATIFEKISDYYYSTFVTKWTMADPCALTHPSLRPDSATICTACVPSADQKSTEYCDLNDEPDNVTYACVVNSSLLDTLVDLSVGAGIDIFGSLFSGMSDSVSDNAIFKYTGLLFILLVVGMVLFSIYRVLFKRPAKFVNQYAPNNQNNQQVISQ